MRRDIAAMAAEVAGLLADHDIRAALAKHDVSPEIIRGVRRDCGPDPEQPVVYPEEGRVRPALEYRRGSASLKRMLRSAGSRRR